jgi:hypothetical protein
LTLVRSALRGESNPSRWRFLAKNSLTEMSRWPAASVWAVARRFVGVAGAETDAEEGLPSDPDGDFSPPLAVAWTAAFFTAATAVAVADRGGDCLAMLLGKKGRHDGEPPFRTAEEAPLPGKLGRV